MEKIVLKIIEFVKNLINASKPLIRKILALLIVVITIMVIASCFNGDDYGNSAANSYNSGVAVQDGNWIYYIDIDGDEPVGVCKVKENGRKTKKVIEGNMAYLNIIDNYIYCLELVYDEENSEYSYNLIKFKTNGEKKEILARDVDAGAVTATEKEVYYFKNDNLYRIKLNGTDREKISDKNISYYQIEGNWIYYIYRNESTEYIAKMKLNGEDDKRIAKANDDTYFEALYVEGGKIYYITSSYDEYFDSEYYLYRMSKKGEKAKKICKIDRNIQSINMQEDEIYYTVSESYDSYVIKSIEYDGTERTTIKKAEMALNINIVDDWIVFVGTNEDYDTVMKMISTDGDKYKNL